MTLLDPILQSPSATEWARKLRQVLEDESRRRTEFRDWLPPSVKAEFINGETVVHSPARNGHNEAGFRIAKVLDAFTLKRRLGQVGIEKNLVGLTRNDYEPDVCWWSQGKRAEFRPDTDVFPAPDIVVEVLSPSTERYDRGVKFEDYAAHGVSEYWIVNPADETIEQHVLHSGTCHLKIKAADGTVHSPLLGGIEFPVRAVFDDAVHAATLESVWRS